MGTGGKIKHDPYLDQQKLRAIEVLIRTGSRGSEWQETGLLHAIEKIIDGKSGISPEDLKRLMKEAANA